MKNRNNILERVYDYTNKKQEPKYQEFDKENIATGMGEDYRYSHQISIRRLGAYTNKPFEKVTKKDLIGFFAMLKEEVKPATFVLYQRCVRTFFRWLGKKETVEWIKIKRNRKIRLPSDIPTKKEIFMLIEKAPYLRYKAIIALLWDSAARIGEVTNLRVKDLIFDSYGGYITVDGKTGMRKIRLIDSIPYLKNYLNEEQKDREDYLFTSRYTDNGKQIKLEGGAVFTMIQRIKEKCGIKREISPHRIRHRKLTEMAKQGYTEVELRLFAGWTKSSDMASIYVHMTDRDVGNKILKKAGIITAEEQEEEENELMPKVCIDPSCKHKNPATAKFCEKCHRPLDAKEIIRMKKVDEITDDLNEGFLTKKDPNLNMKEYVDGYVEKLVKQRIKELTKKE